MKDSDSCWDITKNCHEILANPTQHNTADNITESTKEPKVNWAQKVSENENTEHSIQYLLVSASCMRK